MNNWSRLEYRRRKLLLHRVRLNRTAICPNEPDSPEQRYPWDDDEKKADAEAPAFLCRKSTVHDWRLRIAAGIPAIKMSGRAEVVIANYCVV